MLLLVCAFGQRVTTCSSFDTSIHDPSYGRFELSWEKWDEMLQLWVACKVTAFGFSLEN